MPNFFKKSLYRQFALIMTLFIVLFTIGTVFLLGYQYNLANQNQEAIQKLQEKEKIAEHLEESFNLAFFEARGYFAFASIDFLERFNQRRDEIDIGLIRLKGKANEDTDIHLIQQVRAFYDYYFIQTVPQAINYRSNGELDKVIEISQNGGTEKVNQMVSTLHDYRLALNQKVEEQNNLLNKKVHDSEKTFILFLFSIFLFVLWMTRLLFGRIARPLHEIANASEHLSQGNVSEDTMLIDQMPVERKDELGILSRSFQKMVRNIQANEQELMAQNEELQAQQEELQFTLNQKEEQERIIEKRTQFVHSLTNTLDKKKLLHEVISNIATITDSDKGMIVLLNAEMDYASIGLSEKITQKFLEHLKDSIAIRVMETKEPYQVKRECQTSEHGFDETRFCYDLYIPIISQNERVEAMMVFNRLGRIYTQNEIEEFRAFAKQISLSLDKLLLFEETEQQRRLTQDILNTIHEGVLLIDTQGEIVQANTQICEIFPCKNADSLIGKPFKVWKTELLTSINQEEKVLPFMESIITGTIAHNETIIFKMKDPKNQVIQMYFEPIYRGEVKIGTLMVYRDITKEHEVDQIKSEFVSTVSHELRTPLASILGFTELLIHKNLHQDRKQKYLTTIHQEAKRLTALINDFLDVQRMEARKQTYEKKYIDLLPVIQQVIEAQKVNTNLHKFHVQKEVDEPIVLGDKEKMEQVFHNLISNAIKYSPEGGEINTTIKKENEYLAISIQDEGLGIPEDAIANLFTKFYRIDNSDRRKIGGTGLGLSIVKEIVRGHGGKVSVYSELGKGSTFTIYLPFVEGTFPKKERIGSKEKVNVIVIEDDESLATLIESELKESGFSVEKYKSGEEGLEAIKTFAPDLIVLDILLGDGIDGWKLMEDLKEKEHLANIPIIISTALDEKEKAIKLGVVEYLIKPYQTQKLSQVVLQTLLNKEKSQGQIFVPEKK